MEPCQLIDLVDMDNPWHLRAWRHLEMRSAPLVEALDRRLPRGLVKRRRRVVGQMKARLGGLVKPVRRGSGRSDKSRQGGGDGARAGGGGRRAGAPKQPDGTSRLQPGDLVRVRSLEAVRRTLDRRGICGGLRFMPVQHAYCGKTFRVLKQVNTFLDERDFRVKRLRGVVILEGAYCDGTPLEPEPCDRMCFLFWKEAWLEKVG